MRAVLTSGPTFIEGRQLSTLEATVTVIPTIQLLYGGLPGQPSHPVRCKIQSQPQWTTVDSTGARRRHILLSSFTGAARSPSSLEEVVSASALLVEMLIKCVLFLCPAVKAGKISSTPSASGARLSQSTRMAIPVNRTTRWKRGTLP